jgi:hypothetical protein
MMQSNELHNFNRSLHIQLGLLLLLFIWLFSLSGLLLNHGDWKFSGFWEQRQESTIGFTLPLSVLMDPDPEVRVKEFLQVSGELQRQKRTAERLEFRVESPGIVRDVVVDVTNGSGTQKVIRFNTWGKLRGLHTFNGMSDANPSQSPNWWIANVWRFAMDGIAIGLIIICLSSWVMWYKVRKEYRLGYMILATAFVFAGYFIL